ncbi:hypothetical protein SAMN06265379_10355 [Saccharicrinis carchari]|uniref:DUF4252 domain-containing protein n=1 Tax=Saccharicrinis carchari TaxID=1168039 RepID=A0A521CEL6_SACCC|nr:hypothetical protein [Saccharicrinis carchari]SMO57868.1 hypothetical protein SAMN06265379_10355 [Saccharicrinis carchari]
MKKILILALLMLSVVYTTTDAQCGDDLLKKALKEMGDAQYIKDFNIDLTNVKKDTKTGYVKFSVILNSRSHYKFNTTDGAGNSEKVIMQLYDGDKMLVSNYEGGKMYEAFEFICQKSKVYSLVFSYQGGAEGCSKAVMSLVKQYTEGEMKF